MLESISNSFYSDFVKDIIIFKQDFTITFYYTGGCIEWDKSVKLFCPTLYGFSKLKKTIAFSTQFLYKVYNIIYHIYILCNLNGFIQAESNCEQHVKNT